MAISIKRNSKGLYNLTSTISDEQLHDKKWIPEDEVKKILIERHFMDFIEKAVEIDMEFPNRYYINDRYENIEGKESIHSYMLKLLKEENYQKIYDDFNKVVDKLKLNIPKAE